MLLPSACPSIQYRLRREILKQPPADAEMIELQRQILQDAAVREVIGWQQPDGWLAWNFHGALGMESGLRQLCEKGVEHDHPVVAHALAALETYPDRLNRGIGKVDMLLNETKLGGSLLMPAALFAQAGVEDRPHVQEQIAEALSSFKAVLEVTAVQDFTESYREKLVFKPGVIWPSIYHLRLLAYSQSWRSPAHFALIARAIQRLVELSPIPSIYARCKSQLIAPASFCMHDFNPDMAALDAAQWMMWFHRVELLARLGVVPSVPALQNQVDRLRDMLRSNEGRFTLPLHHRYFSEWGSYTGLMLEQDWRSAQQRASDLTFRSLLILHFADQP